MSDRTTSSSQLSAALRQASDSIREAFDESAESRGRQKEENKKEKNKKREDKRPSSPRPPSPLRPPEFVRPPPPLRPPEFLRPPTPLPLPTRELLLKRHPSITGFVGLLAAASTSQALPTGEDPFAGLEQNTDRETLCITTGKMVWDDLSQVLIWPMNDIDQHDDAMVERVTDLVAFHLPMSLVFAVLTVLAWTRPSWRGDCAREAIRRREFYQHVHNR